MKKLTANDLHDGDRIWIGPFTVREVSNHRCYMEFETGDGSVLYLERKDLVDFKRYTDTATSEPAAEVESAAS